MSHSAGGPEAAHRSRRHWQLDRFIVVRRVDLRDDDREHIGFIENYIDRWLADPQRRLALCDLTRDAIGVSISPVGFSPQLYHRFLKANLLEAFRRRELVLLERPSKASARVASAAAAGADGGTSAGTKDSAKQGSKESNKQGSDAAKAPPPRKTEKTWVEFRLLRKRDGKPVAGARYRLKITDGSVRLGRLDENGTVRVAGIDPGTCEISFLDYDGREWQRR